jgi:hypothetical protein
LHHQSVQAALVLQFRDQVRCGEIDKTTSRERHQQGRNGVLSDSARQQSKGCAEDGNAGGGQVEHYRLAYAEPAMDEDAEVG